LQYGYNEIKSEKQNYFLLFIKKFSGPVELLLWAVMILSYFLGNIKDFYIILALLIFNAIISFFEEYKADQSMEALKQRLAPTARVLRSGEWKEIQARNIVPGDVIRVRMGDIVSADAKIIESEGVEADDSVITGESLPKPKEVNDILYNGSLIKRGEATCVVTGTGYNTLYGKTAKLVAIAKPKSHLQEAIMKIIKYLVLSDFIIIIIMFTFGEIALNLPLLTLVEFLLVLLIASIPVALSAAFTVTMALGTGRLAKKSILVTKLESIEEASTMNVLCADKTGTLTENNMAVKEVEPFGFSESEVVEYAIESSRREDNDPIDNAILNYNVKEVKTRKQLTFSPFDSSTKRTESTVEGGYSVAKGASQVIISMCEVSKSDKKKADETILRFAGNGFKTIAVAKKTNSKWQLAGLIALYDAPRADSKELVQDLKNLGVKVKMITGDNIAVAREIAGELEIGSNIVDLTAEKTNANLEKMIVNADGFADVYPENKYIIVKSLQKEHYIVGMTGDGVNDAPALKQAEVGIAVANATDVAKSAADIILTKNGIEVIIDAIKESRRIFKRMEVYTMIKIIKVFEIIGFVALMFFAFHTFAITPFLLILLMFTNDIVTVSIATDNVEYSQKPNKWSVKPLMITSAVIGGFLIIEAFVMWFINSLFLNLSITAFQTIIFLLFDVDDKLVLFNIRTAKDFWKVKPSIYIVLTSFIGITAGLIMSYYGILVPKIPLIAIIYVFIVSILFFLAIDVIKKPVLKYFGMA
jgi:H+-transporting ATPase